MFGKLGDMANILQKAQEMQKRMEAVQGEILKLEAKAQSQGGLVEAIVSGDLTVRRITIRDECAKTADPQIIEEHVIAAVNGALEQVKMKSKEKMQEVAGGLNLPGLPF